MDKIFNRQAGLIHPDKLTMPILIVGAGSIGSWATLALSKLGCSNLTIMDNDMVEEQNAGSQIYKAADSGIKKVKVLEEKLRMLTDMPISIIPKHWSAKTKLPIDPLIIIAAVDNITVRRELFEHYKGKEKLYIDARMAGNALEIYSTYLNNEKSCKTYEETLFDEKDTLPIACSERSVVYNVFICGGFIGDLVAKQANGEALPPELLVDLKNLTLFT